MSIYTVNSADDHDDGSCTSSHCSFREAINAANANSGQDTIEFNIPGPGPHTIEPSSELPTITDPVVINGYSQPGASPNTNPITEGSNAALMIELDASQVGEDGNGLVVSAGDSMIKGLVINSASSSCTIALSCNNGIIIRNSGGNKIQGNLIGTDISGATAAGNKHIGITIKSDNNTIGGTSSAARNVISGNSGSGIVIWGQNNTVQGNFIGTDISGKDDLGNDGVGISIDTSDNIVGGSEIAARNIISGNEMAGVFINGPGGNIVQGNYIGVNVQGTSALGNQTGIEILNIFGPHNPTFIEDNVISGNRRSGPPTTSRAGAGISIWSSESVTIQGNLIGTDATGTSTISNASDGIFISGLCRSP